MWKRILVSMAAKRSFTAACGVVALSCLAACAGNAASTTGTATSSATSSESAQPSKGLAAQERYLAQARIDLPHANQAALIATAQSICATIRTGSRDDAVGDLAARIGSQPESDQLVTLATDAYCPQPSH